MNNTTPGRVVSHLLALVSTLVFLFGASCAAKAQTPDRFVLAYVTEQNKINVRSAPANAPGGWATGAFPTSIQAGHGVGITIDTALYTPGNVQLLSQLAFTDTSHAVRMVWGGGATVWSDSVVDVPSPPQLLSPVGVYLGHNRWAIAFLRFDRTVFIGVYDKSPAAARFVADFAPFGVLNSGVLGRPSLAFSGDTLVAAWRRDGGYLVTAQAFVQDGIPTFEAPKLIPTPVSNLDPSTVLQQIESDPVVTRAGSSFYLAVVRRRSVQGMGSYCVQLFASPSGQAWSSISVAAPLDVRTDTYLGLAGSSDGALLAAALKSNFEGRGIPSVAHFSNGQWQRAPESEVTAMFNHPAAYKPFVLVGRPPWMPPVPPVVLPGH